MIDYLLSFPDRDTAVAFGKATGYTFDDDIDGVVTPTSNKDYCLTIIGEHFAPTRDAMPSPFQTIPAHTTETWGNTIEHEEQVFDSVPEIAGDGKHWVLFRDIKGTIEVPSEASEFIVWASNQTERVRRRDAEGKFISDDPDTENDEAWETIPVQRPADAPVRKFAGDT